jgi:phenylpyruvate tautomerase PptA (4-oxalocrotonate tautomerase family)
VCTSFTSLSKTKDDSSPAPQRRLLVMRVDGLSEVASDMVELAGEGRETLSVMIEEVEEKGNRNSNK